MMKKWVGMAIDSSKRFSFTIFFAFAYVVYKILIEQALYGNQFGFYLSLAMVLMIFSSGLIHLIFHEVQGRRKWIKIFAANAAAGLLWGGYSMYHFRQLGGEFPAAFALQIFVIGISLCAGFAAYPFLRRPGLGGHLLRLATNLAIAALFSGVLFLGVAFILYTLYALFSLSILRALFDFGIIVSHFVFPVIFLMMYPRYEWEKTNLEDEEAAAVSLHDSGDVQMVYRVVLNYIAMPLLLIYNVILYTYILSTMIQWEMPINSFSYLVSFFLVVSLLTIYLLKGYDHHRNVFESWIHKSLGYFAVSLVIPTICMLYGMFVRIAYYGVTVPRYYIVLLGFFSIYALALLFFLGKRAQSALVVSFVCALLVSAFGYFSAPEVTYRSQVAQMSKIVGQDVLRAESQVLSERMAELPYEDMRDLESSVHVIGFLGHLERLNPVLYDSVYYGNQYAKFIDLAATDASGESRNNDSYLQYYYNQSESMFVKTEASDAWQLILLDHDLVEIQGFVRVESDGSSIHLYSENGPAIERIELSDIIATGFGERDITIKGVEYKLMVMIDHAYIPESTMDGAFRVVITILKK